MKAFIILVIGVLFFYKCTGEPILSELYSNSIKLIVKGTYESNSPYDWQTPIFENDVLPATVNTDVAASDLKFYFDIAEIRMSKGTKLPKNEDAEDYWQLFARDRVLLCSNYGAFYNKELENCKKNDGTTKLNDFFNEGFSYPAVDVPGESFRQLALYFRKMITYPSGTYRKDSGALVKDDTTNFDDKVIYGRDIEPYYQYSNGGGSDEDPLLFPLRKNDFNTLNFKSNGAPVVLEVRVFLKNLMMKHAIEEVYDLGDGTSTDVNRVLIGPSDWRINHDFTNSTDDAKYRLGSHILLTARSYFPDEVGSLQINNSGATPTSLYYWALMKQGESFNPDVTGDPKLPYAATKGGTSGTITNLPEGFYDLYMTCDKNWQTAGGQVAGNDGYPETAISCVTNIQILKNQIASPTVNCTCP